MANRPIRWWFFSTIALVAVSAVVVLSLVFLYVLNEHSLAGIRSSLILQAKVLQEDVLVHLAAGRLADIDRLCKNRGGMTGLRFTVILPSGEVVGDSAEDPHRMDNHGGRSEIRAALASHAPAFSLRFSDTLNRKMLYVAVPLAGEKHPAAVVAVLRCSLPLEEVETGSAAMGRGIGAVVLAALLFALGMAMLLSRRLSRPFAGIAAAMERIAGGDVSCRSVTLRSDGHPAEIAAVHRALNRLAGELDRRIGAMVSRHQELETVFAAMIEAVIVIGPDGRLRKFNRAAVRMLKVDEERALGRLVLESIRNADLQAMVAHLLEKNGEESLEKEITLVDGGEEKTLHAHGAVLVDERGGAAGALVVLHDVTRLKRLETLRRDFVANVSHELKTPITSIKGFVETLLEGEDTDLQTAAGFLRIVDNNIDRLTAIIDDLLTLSRIERDEEGGELEMRDVPLDRLLAGAIDICQPQAAAKQIAINLRCARSLAVRVNGPLIEQAVVNLVINAVQYSDAGKEIEVRGGREGDAVKIEVEDWGIGIAAQHLPRLFERFYRSDKARSRKLGGTGLGLAIVKHIVQAHRGRVSVRSTPGSGTTFTILLPGSKPASR